MVEAQYTFSCSHQGPSEPLSQSTKGFKKAKSANAIIQYDKGINVNNLTVVHVPDGSLITILLSVYSHGSKL